MAFADLLGLIRHLVFVDRSVKCSSCEILERQLVLEREKAMQYLAFLNIARDEVNVERERCEDLHTIILKYTGVIKAEFIEEAPSKNFKPIVNFELASHKAARLSRESYERRKSKAEPVIETGE